MKVTVIIIILMIFFVLKSHSANKSHNDLVAIDTGVIKGSVHHICQVYAVGKNIIGTLKSVEVRMGWASHY